MLNNPFSNIFYFYMLSVIAGTLSSCQYEFMNLLFFFSRYKTNKKFSCSVVCHIVREQIGATESSPLDLIMNKIFDVDFKRLELYIVFFKRVMQYTVTMRRKREILFDFWLTEKLSKRWNWFFKPGKKERKARIGEITNQNKWWAGNNKLLAHVQTAGLKKINLGEMENFELILEVMTYESREEKKTVSYGEEDRKYAWWERRAGKALW